MKLQTLTSFLGGVGLILDLGATRSKTTIPLNSSKADFEAIKSDWTITGKDIEYAYEEFGRKFRKEKYSNQQS